MVLYRLNKNENPHSVLMLKDYMFNNGVLKGVIQTITAPVFGCIGEGRYASFICDYMCNLKYKKDTKNQPEYISNKNAYTFNFNDLESADAVYLCKEQRSVFCRQYNSNYKTISQFEMDFNILEQIGR